MDTISIAYPGRIGIHTKHYKGFGFQTPPSYSRLVSTASSLNFQSLRKFCPLQLKYVQEKSCGYSLNWGNLGCRTKPTSQNSIFGHHFCRFIVDCRKNPKPQLPKSLNSGYGYRLSGGNLNSRTKPPSQDFEFGGHLECTRNPKSELRASREPNSELQASVVVDGAVELENGDDEESGLMKDWTPPRYIWRALAAWVIAGQVIARIAKGRIHWKNSLQQLEVVGPGSTGVALLTAAFVGMAFTIQFVREFTRLGLTRSVGGVLGLALSRELSPVVTAIIVAGRVGSAFAAELGTMQVSEQTDTLRVLGTDPVDYLIVPRVLACCLALPILTLVCFSVAMAASVFLADAVYNVSANIILDSARRALHPWDIISAMVKSTVFGGLISVVSCAWGVTTLGGAKGVGESTTSAVVISLVCIFVADFVLSWCFFQGAGDALKAAMG